MMGRKPTADYQFSNIFIDFLIRWRYNLPMENINTEILYQFCNSSNPDIQSRVTKLVWPNDKPRYHVSFKPANLTEFSTFNFPGPVSWSGYALAADAIAKAQEIIGI